MRLHLAASLLFAAVALAPAARADVPFSVQYLDNAVEVRDQEKFPDWIVVVFPSAPPSGRPAAWPALVEPEFHTEIDRKVLGTPKLWILERAALDDLKAAARDNDDQLDGPVAKLLQDRGVECATLTLEEKASLPLTAPNRNLITYALEEASKARCVMKLVNQGSIQGEPFKRSASWAAFMPKKKKASPASSSSAAAAALSASAVAVVSAALVASAAPVASAIPSATPPREAVVPEPNSAKGCGCAVASDGEAARPLLLSGLLGLLAAVRSRRRVRA